MAAPFARLVCSLALLLAAGGACAADELTPTLQEYARQNLTCTEWTNSCIVCKRDEAGAPHCSTPGIACEPEPIRCVGNKNETAQ